MDPERRSDGKHADRSLHWRNYVWFDIRGLLLLPAVVFFLVLVGLRGVARGASAFVILENVCLLAIPVVILIWLLRERARDRHRPR